MNTNFPVDIFIRLPRLAFLRNKLRRLPTHFFNKMLFAKTKIMKNRTK